MRRLFGKVEQVRKGERAWPDVTPRRELYRKNAS